MSKESQLYGYAGRIVKIDLSTGSTTFLNTIDYAKDYIGGRGIAQRLYWEMVKPEIAAFDPENYLIFMTGALAGTGAPTSARMTLVGKSPATYPREMNFVSNMAGGFAPILKLAGFDGIIVHGKAERPVYLLIQDNEIEIRDAAGGLWGLDTYSTKDELWRRHGKESEIMTIGQAGENLVREAIIQTSGLNSFSQGGFGAVMGSKKLKAIVANGTGAIHVADSENLLDAIYISSRLVSKKETEDGLINQFRNVWGSLPTLLSQEVKAGTARMTKVACDACPLACITGYKYLDGAGAGAVKCSIGGGLYNKVEWGVDTMEEGQGNQVLPFLNRDSLVSIPLWEKYGVNAHFMEMFSQGLLGILYKMIEKGILTEANSGLPIDKIGKPEFAQELLKKIVFREDGFGNDMAEGPARFCEKFGKEAMDLWHDNYYEGEATLNVSQYTLKIGGEGNMPDNLCRVAGLRTREVVCRSWFYGQIDSNDRLDPQFTKTDVMLQSRRNVAKKFLGVENACDDPDDYGYAPMIAKYALQQQEIIDCLGQCAFVFILTFTNYTDDFTGELMSARFLNSVLGSDFTEKELADKFAMRMINLERAILFREGRTREEDTNPDVMFTDHGGQYDRTAFKKSVEDFYKTMEWDFITGLPTRNSFELLGLKEIADELENKYQLPLA